MLKIAAAVLLFTAAVTALVLLYPVLDFRVWMGVLVLAIPVVGTTGGTLIARARADAFDRIDPMNAR